jgi:hypothetical protein
VHCQWQLEAPARAHTRSDEHARPFTHGQGTVRRRATAAAAAAASVTAAGGWAHSAARLSGTVPGSLS